MEWLTEKFNGVVDVRFHTTGGGVIVAQGADVVTALKGDSLNSATMIKTHVNPKWWVDLPNPNGGRPIRCLMEPGVYQLASNVMFKTDFAIAFQEWLFEDVLPKLRASGGYIMPTATSEQLDALKTQIFVQQMSIEMQQVQIGELRDAQWLRAKMFSFLSDRVVFKPGSYLLSSDIKTEFLKSINSSFKKKDEAEILLNVGAIAVLVDDWCKSHTEPKGKRPHVSKKNFFGDLENAAWDNEDSSRFYPAIAGIGE